MEPADLMQIVRELQERAIKGNVSKPHKNQAKTQKMLVLWMIHFPPNHKSQGKSNVRTATHVVVTQVQNKLAGWDYAKKAPKLVSKICGTNAWAKSPL